VLDAKKEPKRRLRSGDKIAVGDFVRVVFKMKAAKERTYLLLEDFKLAGCEPVEKTSGRKVCRGHCAHVELRADRTAIFFNELGTDEHEVSYDIEAILPGRFTALPAKIETMYEARCQATSASFGVEVKAA
jgi:alpha-2-macroglobulin